MSMCIFDYLIGISLVFHLWLHQANHALLLFVHKYLFLCKLWTHRFLFECFWTFVYILFPCVNFTVIIWHLFKKNHKIFDRFSCLVINWKMHLTSLREPASVQLQPSLSGKAMCCLESHPLSNVSWYLSVIIVSAFVTLYILKTSFCDLSNWN